MKRRKDVNMKRGQERGSNYERRVGDKKVKGDRRR